MEIIKNLIKDFAPKLNSEEVEQIISKFEIQYFEKGKYFLKKKQICNYLSFVQSGCFKVFHIDEDKEVNVWFAFENMPITEMQSFINQKPSEYAIKALETAEIISISFEDLNKLYEILENEIIPMYYENRETWRQVVKNGMRDVRIQFDSNRMAHEYYELMYQ